MKLEDRIAKHRRMAESYRDKYVLQKVQEGESYDEWVFTDDAVYTSPPYFVADQELVLKDVATHWDTAATIEAKAYGVEFPPDWKPVDFKVWPAENGFVMRYRWQGTSQTTGAVMASTRSASSTRTTMPRSPTGPPTSTTKSTARSWNWPSTRADRSATTSTCRPWASTSPSTG